MQPESAEELHPQSKIETLADDAKSYITTLFELYKLKLTDKVSSGGALIATYLILSLFALLVLILVSIGGALWINECMHSSFAGFFIVAGFYLLLCLLLMATKGSLVKKPVTTAIIKGILSDD